MTRRSTMLRVVAILMIIFGAIELVILIGSFVTLSALLSLVGGTSADVAEILAQAGYDYHGPIMAALAVGVIACVAEFVAGILGLALKSKKSVFITGCIIIIIQVISLILSFATGSFSWTNLVVFILPVLYLIGAKNCEQ